MRDPVSLLLAKDGDLIQISYLSQNKGNVLTLLQLRKSLYVYICASDVIAKGICKAFSREIRATAGYQLCRWILNKLMYIDFEVMDTSTTQESQISLIHLQLLFVHRR